MYIPEFWVGVVFTLSAEMIMFFLYGIITGFITKWRENNGKA